MAETKIILLIGRSGQGKSTLANVMAGIKNQFEESEESVSKTRKIQVEQFEDKKNNINYLVIDTPGIGDTKLSNDEVLDIIAEAVYLVKDGLNQVFFVVSSRFDQSAMATYNLLRTIIFDEHVAEHTTIVRTRFIDFKKKSTCEADIELMVKEVGKERDKLKEKIDDNEKKIENLSSNSDQYQKLLKETVQLRKELTATNLAEVIESCQRKVVHVDNPPVNTDDEEDLKLNEKKREKSRKILLDHLNKSCQNQKTPYKPPKLQGLSADIIEYMEEKERKRKELEEKKKKLGLETKKEEKTKVISDVDRTEQIKDTEPIENDKSKSEKISAKDEEDNKIELINLKGEMENNQALEEKNQDSRIKKSVIIEEKITRLEEEIKELEEAKELQEKIQKIEESIREVVRKHILNNCDDVNKLLGGDILIGKIKTIENSSDLSLSELDINELMKEEKECKTKLKEKGVEDQTLDEIEKEIKQKEKRLLDLKKELINDEEIFGKWQKQGFSIQQVQEWVDALGRSFDPESDAFFCAWLRDSKQIMAEKNLNDEKIKQLRIEYNPQQNDKTGETKTVLLIGRSGRGKSTLANVLLNKNGNFEEVFKESRRSVSETRRIQVGEFEEDGIKYRVIDTPGISDTKMSDNEILDIITEAAYLTRNGVSQVFFVISKRFDEYEMATYNLLRTTIFDEHITKHTTIVRTNFRDFKKDEKCKTDINSMKKESQAKKSELEEKITVKKREIEVLTSNNEQYQKLLTEIKQLEKESKSALTEIIDSCQGRVIHVDNPPLGIKSISSRELELNKKKRNNSRQRVLEHLNSKDCQNIYNPSKLQKLSGEIVEYMEEKERKRKELEEKKKKLDLTNKIKKESESEKNEGVRTNKGTEDESEKILAENKKIGSVLEKEEKKEEETSNNKQELRSSKTNFKAIIKSDIASLEEEIKELEEAKGLQAELKKAEDKIRGVIREHILNNKEEINNVLGGDILIKSITVKDNSDFSPDELDFSELRKKEEELGKQLEEKGVEDQTLEQIEDEIKKKEQKLLDLKKELLNDKFDKEFFYIF
ncbi:MAG: hypothetical protein MRERV_20c049 [Mycoplasmataceae bacterium RV_VA103A]|nr:MAG: hypothetical protein MRERV_20c049 [Mycoplasmataceae bacterium RV_VA103A]